LGAGGSLGAAGGGSGCTGSRTSNYGGGAAGKCINLNGYAVTWAPQGTTYGDIS
jgi:hypothetical protein